MISQSQSKIDLPARLCAAAALGLTLFATGCATPQDGRDDYRAPTRGDVSSIPWNRPQGWEGQAGIPGFGGNFGTR